MTRLTFVAWCAIVVCTVLPVCGQQPRADRGSQTRGPHPRARPVTGKVTPGVEAIDRVMLRYLDRIGCTGATVAVARGGVLIHSRGYGWSDKARTVPMQPDTLIGIASCEKPITAAAIRQLARAGRLDLKAGVFKLLKVQPHGKVVDPRIWQITIEHLLDHKPGWQGRPIDTALAAAKRSSRQDPVPAELALANIMAQRLTSDPGTAYKYCNECYDILRYVILKVSGQRPVDYFRTTLFDRTQENELKGFEASKVHRRPGDPPIVSNEGGPVSASAPALCEFMHHFWETGEPRDNTTPRWEKDGSLPGSTALMLWRHDGLDLAVLFNGRGSPKHDAIRRDLEEALKQTPGAGTE
jgi:CubicO group peptidase (beta-lactamase class C family)